MSSGFAHLWTWQQHEALLSLVHVIVQVPRSINIIDTIESYITNNHVLRVALRDISVVTNYDFIETVKARNNHGLSQTLWKAKQSQQRKSKHLLHSVVSNHPQNKLTSQEIGNQFMFVLYNINDKSIKSDNFKIYLVSSIIVSLIISVLFGMVALDIGIDIAIGIILLLLLIIVLFVVFCIIAHITYSENTYRIIFDFMNNCVYICNNWNILSTSKDNLNKRKICTCDNFVMIRLINRRLASKMNDIKDSSYDIIVNIVVRNEQPDHRQFQDANSIANDHVITAVISNTQLRFCKIRRANKPFFVNVDNFLNSVSLKNDDCKESSM